MQHDKEAKTQSRKKVGYGADSDTDSDDETKSAAVAKKGSSSRQIKNAMKEYNATKRSSTSN